MSGKKQHYIPRSFLRGFKIPSKKDKIWIYRTNNSTPVQTSISNTGHKKNFYSKFSSCAKSSLDDEITKYENRFAKEVKALRLMQVGDVIDASQVSEIISHLVIRNLHIRSFMTSGMEKIIETFAGEKQKSAMADMFSSIDPPKQLLDAFHEQISKLGLVEKAGLQEYTLSEICRFLMREKMPSVWPSIESQIDLFASVLTENLSSTVSNAHQKALENNILPQVRIEYLEKFEWKIMGAPSETAILPDCIGLGMDNNGEWSALIAVGQEDLQAVVFPISAELMVVGSLNGTTVDTSQFNELAAKSSELYFWSCTENKEFDGLVRLIGTSTEKILSEALNDVVKGKIKSEDKDVDLEDISKNESGISLGFTDNWDQENAELATEYIKQLVVLFNRDKNISKLSEIVVTIDLEASLNELDRGELRDRAVKFEKGELQHCPGKAVLSMKNGEIFWQLVVCDWVIDEIVNAEVNGKRTAIAVFWGLLASVHLQQSIENRFLGFFVDAKPKTFEDYFFHHSYNILKAYYCNWQAALADPTQTDFHFDYVKDGLQNLEHDLSELAAKFETDNNFEDCIASVLNVLVRLLVSVARYLGYVHRVGQDASHVDEIEELFSEMNMKDWFGLFQSDLSKFVEALGSWDSKAEVYAINQHLLRWLWYTGIVPERDDNSENGVYVKFVDLQTVFA